LLLALFVACFWQEGKSETAAPTPAPAAARSLAGEGLSLNDPGRDHTPLLETNRSR